MQSVIVNLGLPSVDQSTSPFNNMDARISENRIAHLANFQTESGILERFLKKIYSFKGRGMTSSLNTLS
jgi:hypothetical protein